MVFRLLDESQVALRKTASNWHWTKASLTQTQFRQQKFKHTINTSNRVDIAIKKISLEEYFYSLKGTHS